MSPDVTLRTPQIVTSGCFFEGGSADCVASRRFASRRDGRNVTLNACCGGAQAARRGRFQEGDSVSGTNGVGGLERLRMRQASLPRSEPEEVSSCFDRVLQGAAVGRSQERTVSARLEVTFGFGESWGKR